MGLWSLWVGVDSDPPRGAEAQAEILKPELSGFQQDGNWQDYGFFFSWTGPGGLLAGVCHCSQDWAFGPELTTPNGSEACVPCSSASGLICPPSAA